MAKIYVNGDAQEVTLPLNVSELNGSRRSRNADNCLLRLG